MQTNLKMTQLLAFALAVAPVTGRAVEATPPPAPSGARNENLPGLIREAEKGVFFLRVLDAGGKPIATGTGFLVDDQGSLLTSLHVIRPASVPASSAEAIGADGKTHAVKGVTASDESLDLAVLKLEQMPEGAVPVPLAADLPPERGSYVLALGQVRAYLYDGHRLCPEARKAHRMNFLDYNAGHFREKFFPFAGDPNHPTPANGVADPSESAA
jgi:S1-C subfamily serine protease